MMDADALFPLGFHPITHGFLPENTIIFAPVKSRIDNQVRYYYIDFGLSAYFPPGSGGPKMVTGMAARDKDIPELSWDIPFDPFKVDIFCLGNLFKKSLYLVCLMMFYLVSVKTVNSVLPIAN